MRLGSIVARLTSVNAMVMAFGLLTGPLLARSLGPGGRGAVAAVAAPLALAPYVLGIGLVTFVIREAARGRSTGELLGSVGLIYLVIGMIAVVAAHPVAVYFAQGRAPVRIALLIGFYCMPIFLIGGLLLGIASGLQRWTMVITARLLPATIGLAATVALYVTGLLNVSEALAIVVVSNFLAIVPTLGVLKEALPLRVRGSVMRESFWYGLPSWLWQISLLTNGRLDQVVMVSLTTSSQLGLYAVAVSITGVSGVFSSALGLALLPRVTKGETALVARALSITLAVSVGMNIGLAVACPVILPLLFGASFRDAVPMAWILAAAAVPNTGTQVLTASLLGAGRPKLVAAGELTAVGITVSGLLLLVGPLGGVGAASVSLAAYSVTFVVLVVGAMREFRLPLRGLIVPTRRDLLAQGVLVRSQLGRIMRHHSGASAA